VEGVAGTIVVEERAANIRLGGPRSKPTFLFDGLAIRVIFKEKLLNFTYLSGLIPIKVILQPKRLVMTTTSPNTYNVNLPWVESPFFEEEIKKANLSPLTEQLVRQYAEQGYLIFDPQIDTATIDAAREQAMPLYPQRHPFNRLQDIWQEIPAVQQIAAAPRVLELLRLMYRREPIPFQTLNFNVGTQQKTHSDSIHFNSIPQRFMCGVWVALEDVRDDNGPLHYYPGSHKLPFYDLVDMGLKGTIAQSLEEIYGGTYKRYEDFIQSMIAAQGLPKAVLNMKKGQAILWYLLYAPPLRLGPR
jgi:hypothetical protein